MSTGTQLEGEEPRPWRRRVLPVLGLALACSVVFLLSTRWGIGVRPDSAFFLGFPIFLHGNAPAYHWLIVGLSELGLDRLAVAGWSNYFFFLFNSLAVWWLIRCITESDLSAVLGAAMFVSAPAVIGLHVTVLAEGMYLSFLLLAIGCMARYVETSRGGYLIAAAVATVICILARFNAVPLIVLGPLAIIALGQMNLGGRLTASAVFVGIVVLSIAGWLYLESVGGRAGTGRPFALYGNATLAVLEQGIVSVWVYFFPSSFVPFAIKLLAVAGLAAVLIAGTYLGWRKWRADRADRGTAARFETLPMIAAVYVFGHVAVLLLALLVEANLPLKTSYMLPVFTLSVIAISGMAFSQLRRTRFWRLTSLAMLAFAGTVVAANVLRSGGLVGEFYREGNFYASPVWYESPLLARLKDSDPAVKVYSNAPDAVWHVLGDREVSWLPMMSNRRTGEPFPGISFDDQMTQLRTELEAGQSIIAYFPAITWRFYLPDEPMLEEMLGVSIVLEESDGRLYGIR